MTIFMKEDLRMTRIMAKPKSLSLINSMTSSKGLSNRAKSKANAYWLAIASMLRSPTITD
jgi:hypothetical protein